MESSQPLLSKSHQRAVPEARSPDARADLRAIDRDIAVQIRHCIDRYLAKRNGDVKKLKPPRTGLRLRCGDYRAFFDPKDDHAIEITGVKNRREAYR